MEPISAIATLGSGLLNFFGGQSAQDKAIEAQARTNAENWAHSLYMAQNSIQMRKADAEAAGIHPLYAMGAPTMSFAPSQVGAAGTPYNSMAPLAGAMRSMGQDLSRSALQQTDVGEKVAGIQTAQQVASNSLDLDIKKANLDLLRARLANLTGTPPVGPFPVPESSKIEGRPPLMFGGNRVDTAPDTSNAEDYEKRYGDDGPASWAINSAILARDAVHNLKKYAGTLPGGPNFVPPGTVNRWAVQDYWNKIDLPVRPTYRGSAYR